MKKKITTIATYVIMLALVATVTGCGGKKAVKVPDDSKTSGSATTANIAVTVTAYSI